MKTRNEEISLCQSLLNDVNNFMECCETTNPSIYSSEIQNKLVKNNFQGLPENVPSHQEIQRYSTGITDS